jgi:hypothetical protein
MPVNKLRFAWWGAEEVGRAGSRFYLENLGPGEVAGIALYLNFDMIGSPNFVSFVLDGDGSDSGLMHPPGSGAIERIFLDYFAGQSLPTLPTGGSNHFPLDFASLGIPIGGLFGGAEGVKSPGEAATFGGTAGDPYDPCYHLACDTFFNISFQALDRHSDAAAHAILTLAMGPDLAFGCEQDPQVPVQEICNNGIDDDCDTLVDLDDGDDCVPLLVYLESFTARTTPRGVLLRWSTTAEVDNAGFRILRARTDPERGLLEIEPVAVSPLISPRGSALDGAQYEYVDGSPQKSGQVFYYLEDVDLSGQVTRHGPIGLQVRGGWGKPGR